MGDPGAVGQGGVHRAVAVAGHVQRLGDLLVVGLEAGLPADPEADLDAGEGVRPVALLLTLALHRQAAVLLLELLQEEDGVDARAGPQRAEQQDRKSTRLNSSHLGISY